MRQLDQAGLLSRVIERDELTPEIVDALADEVAAFHDRTARATAELPYGREEAGATARARQFLRDAAGDS